MIFREPYNSISPFKVYVTVGVLILIGSAFLRIYTITEKSLWHNEAVCVNDYEGSFATTLKNARQGISPVGYPLLLWGIEKISISPLAVRFLSWVPSILSVLLILPMC